MALVARGKRERGRREIRDFLSPSVSGLMGDHHKSQEELQGKKPGSKRFSVSTATAGVWQERLISRGKSMKEKEAILLCTVILAGIPRFGVPFFLL